MDHIHGTGITQLNEFFFQVNILACEGRCFNGMRDLLPLVGIEPGNDVLDPGQPVLVHSLTQADGRVDIKVPEMVSGNGYLITGDFPHPVDIPQQYIQPLFGDLDAGERVPGLSITHPVLGPGLIQFPYISPYYGIGNTPQQFKAEIDLDEGISLFHAFLDPVGSNSRIARGWRICIHPYPVAVFTSKQLVNRHPVCLSRQVPQGHLNSRNTPSGPAMSSELFQVLKYLFNTALV